VNEKIEGFFDVCRMAGLTGSQGVLIPVKNVEDLMLRDDTIDAVAAGKFHIYPLVRLEDGIQILTGVTAGQRDSRGRFEPDSVFARVDERLSRMAQTLKEFE
jgi:predicted ATP-dependent protease